MRSVVEALADLASGVSYAKASRNVWDKSKPAEEPAGAQDDHTHGDHTHGDAGTRKTDLAQDAAPVAGSGVSGSGSKSWLSQRGRNAWHVAGDIVEQYSSVLYAHVEQGIHAREASLRATNDGVKAAGQVPPQPITYLLDEIPVYIKHAGGKSRVAWTVLAVAEILWRPGRTSKDPLQRENRLRLGRALPGTASADTWTLVLDELGTTPDVVIADFGAAIAGAVSATYAGKGVLEIPSLYHFIRAMAEMLGETAGYNEHKNKSRIPNPMLSKHLSRVSREALVDGGVAGWSRWWDEFEQMAADLNAPPAPLRVRRTLFEDRIKAAIPVLAAQPFLPGSNAGIEIQNRSLLKPLLRGRQQQYRNIARTNALFDLIVCKENGLFLDTDLITRLILDDNLAHGGWATPLRSFDDIQPPRLTGEDGFEKLSYASLLDSGLVPALLEVRRGRRTAVTS